LQLSVDKFPFLNGGYATNNIVKITPSRKGDKISGQGERE